jgi:ATP phosphoribosyltransferase
LKDACSLRYQKVSLGCYTLPVLSQLALPLTSAHLVTEGRLNQAALNLLEGADIQFRRENRLDIALVKNLPIALIFLPAADIPTFVGQGRVDLGITGWDQVREHDATVKAAAAKEGSSTQVSGSEMIMELEFGACKLQVQVPEKGQYSSSADLIGRTVGTSFVGLTEEYFAQLEAQSNEVAKDALPSQKLRTKIIELSGSVEAACALGVADGIVDLVGKAPLPTCSLLFSLLPGVYI